MVSYGPQVQTKGSGHVTARFRQRQSVASHLRGHQVADVQGMLAERIDAAYAMHRSTGTLAARPSEAVRLEPV